MLLVMRETAPGTFSALKNGSVIATSRVKVLRCQSPLQLTGHYQPQSRAPSSRLPLPIHGETASATYLRISSGLF